MPKAKELIIKEGVSELKKIRLKQRSIQRQKRVNCILLIKESRFKTRQQLADHLGIHIRTQERWLNQYTNEGIDSLLSDKPQNKKSRFISPEVHTGLEKKVKDAENPLLGYWDAQRWVEEEFGVKITYHWLRKYMINQFKTKLKSPRKSHIKKDKQAVAAFFKTT